jgi:hypothetical protein
VDACERLEVELDFWDDTVGAFEPAKVLRQPRAGFSDVEIDSTDHQRVRLLRELEFWDQGERDPELREKLILQSWGLYQTTGPTYRFVISFPAGHRVNGMARRLSVSFSLPVGLPAEYREQLVSFLRSLRMGEPNFVDGWEETEPDLTADRPRE